jgi:hypothetical protein
MKWIVKPEASLQLEYLHSVPPDVEPNTGCQENSSVFEGAKHARKVLPGCVH